MASNEPTGPPQAAGDLPVVQIRNLRKTFGDLTVLEAGGSLHTVGLSGLGKTTLLRCINSLAGIDGGEVLVDGKLVTNGLLLAASTPPPPAKRRLSWQR